MTDETIFDELRHLCATILYADPASITLDTDLYSDLEADSLDLAEVFAAIERKFGQALDAPALAQVRTVADAVELVRARLDRRHTLPTAP
ncbi:acyl carrier protein [Nonomuraea sp. NPDC001699]